MIEVNNFDNWIEDSEAGKFGSGASEKIWLVNPENEEISSQMQKLLKKFIIDRRNRIIEIYNLDSEV